MQVTHTDVNDSTHLTVGNTNTQEFGISNNAEFFKVLSDSLYSDKILAVVREIICNAHDAHINNNIDKPIEITLTDTEFTVQDFGLGITKEDMHPIYCIYGNSTKANDSNQTGGFGLGSKAPFAYTDTFTVTSSHAGIQTVYSLSKGSEETNGKPDIKTIISVENTQSGVTVTVPIKLNNTDILFFKNNIKNVVLQGNINAKLNNELLNTWNYSEGFSHFKRDIYSPNRIWIKYGSVIYPIPKEYDILLNHDNIVLEAKPNTISVTPSRESLSLNTQTLKTIKTLQENFLKNINKLIKNKQFIKQCAKKDVDTYSEYDIFKNIFRRYNTGNLIFQSQDFKFTNNNIFTYEEYTHFYLKKLIKNTKNLYFKYLIDYLKIKYPEYTNFYRQLYKYQKILSLDYKFMYLSLSDFYNKYKYIYFKKIYSQYVFDIQYTKKHSINNFNVVDFQKILFTNNIKNIDEILKTSDKNHLIIKVLKKEKNTYQKDIDFFTNKKFNVIDKVNFITKKSTFIKSTQSFPIIKHYLKDKDLNEYKLQNDFSNYIDEIDISNPKDYVIFLKTKLFSHEKTSWDNRMYKIEGFGSNTDYNQLVKIFPNALLIQNKKTYNRLIQKGFKEGIFELEQYIDKKLNTNEVYNYVSFIKFCTKNFYGLDSIILKNPFLIKLFNLKLIDQSLIDLYKWYDYSGFENKIFKKDNCTDTLLDKYDFSWLNMFETCKHAKPGNIQYKTLALILENKIND